MVKKISLAKFLTQLKPLLVGQSDEERSIFGFKMFDLDLDGKITAQDLVGILAGIKKGTGIYLEVKKLVDEYLKSNIG